MSEETPPRTVAGIERALDVLSLFAEEGVVDLGVTEIAERLDLSKAVVHRILSSFRVKDYVEVDPDSRRYRLGARALTLGLAYLDRIDELAMARAALRELSSRTGETATLSVRVEWKRVYVDQVTPPRDIKMVVRLGGAYPLHAGASSKAMLAFLPTDLRAEYLDTHELVALTPATVTDRGRLERELDEIRRRGYAVSFGERQAGAGSVAAPVLGRSGELLAVVSVCGPVERFRGEVDEVAAALTEVVGRMSRRFGRLDAATTRS